MSNELPVMNMDTSETDCCPKFEPELWDEKTFEFDNLLFARNRTISFLHIPLNLGSIMKKSNAAIELANAGVDDKYLILSRDLSSWKAEHLFLVSKEVKGLFSVWLSGVFMTKVFEGPYKEAPNWMKEMEKFVETKGKKSKKMYSFYTTCPNCAKHYGKNYVVIFAEIEKE